MDAAAVNSPADDRPPGGRRSAGTPRAEARRREMPDRVTDDLAVKGLRLDWCTSRILACKAI